MIVEFFVNAFCGLLSGLMAGIRAISIPVDAIAVLGEIVSYGAYIVGADFLLLFASVVAFWVALKFTVGLGLFIWDLLPLT